MSHTFILLLILLSQLCTLLPKALKWISMLSTQLSRSHTYNFLYCLHFSLFLYSSVRLSLHLQAHAGVHHFRRMCVSVCVCVWKPIPVLTFHSPFLLDFGHTFIYTLAPPFFPVPLFLLILHSSLLTCHINYSHSIFSPYLLLRVLLLSSFFFSLTYTIPCSFFHFAPPVCGVNCHKACRSWLAVECRKRAKSISHETPPALQARSYSFPPPSNSHSNLQDTGMCINTCTHTV